MNKNTLFINNFISKYCHILIVLFLFIITFIAYWQVLNHDFVNFDDNQYIYENRFVQQGLTFKSIIWAFTTIHMANWHPLTWLSHIIVFDFFGFNPSGHHLTNLFLHILNTILLYLIFKLMTDRLWQSFFIAALFALHPIHVESVAWISERKDVLSTFFWLITMLFYVYYSKHPELKRYLLFLA